MQVGVVGKSELSEKTGYKLKLRDYALTAVAKAPEPEKEIEPEAVIDEV